jgi:D-sedoheptulose 7-phosphate isomerase
MRFLMAPGRIFDDRENKVPAATRFYPMIEAVAQPGDADRYVGHYLSALVEMLRNLNIAAIVTLVEWLRETRAAGGTVFIIGNGGSASTASHFACDLQKAASFGRPDRFRTLALGDSLPNLTAYENDVGYESVFVEPLKNFAKRGDLLIAISGSGNSANVLRAVEYARRIGCRTVGLTGFHGGRLGQMVDLEIGVAGDHMGRIEDLHLVVCEMAAYRFMQIDDSPADA